MAIYSSHKVATQISHRVSSLNHHWRLDMQLTMVNEVCCGKCERTTLYRASTLEKIFRHLPQSARDDQQIGFVCPHCKHLALADVRVWRGLLHSAGPGSPALSGHPKPATCGHLKTGHL